MNQAPRTAKRTNTATKSIKPRTPPHMPKRVELASKRRQQIRNLKLNLKPLKLHRERRPAMKSNNAPPRPLLVELKKNHYQQKK